MEQNYILELKNICKSFSGVTVLDNVDFSLKQGEIHALVGENGAGKSTLMNIIDGVIIPNDGEIFINGKKVNIKNPHHAQEQGIAFVHQEIALCPDVSVAENIFMSTINNSKKLVVDYKSLYLKTLEILKELADIAPDTSVGGLSLSNQQIIEIAKALSMNCKVLILDEPTAALSESETNSLFKIMWKLKAQGISIIYISHRMSEIFSVCDRVTILRDGCNRGTCETQELNEEKIVNKMVGREIKDIYPKKNVVKNTEPIFEIKSFNDGKRFKNINFKLFKGEIIGIAGLVGAGRSEVAQAICGLRWKSNGSVFCKGKEVVIKNYKDAIANKIVYLTEDRKQEGLFLEMSIFNNISAIKLKSVAENGLINKTKEINQAMDYIEKMGIRCRDVHQQVSTLSGGNQQKVLISKLLMIEPDIIFMDEPTRGIDVGAKSEIHKLIRTLANKGIGVVIISSELPEIIGMCDRVIIMHEGKQMGELSDDSITEENIMHYASGIN